MNSTELPEYGEDLAPIMDGDVIDWALMPFVDTMGVLFPVVIIGGVMAMLWIYSGSIQLPLVVSILLAGLMIPFLPSGLVGLLEIFIILGTAIALFAVWYSGRELGGPR